MILELDRDDQIQLLIELVREVGRLHRRGMVHGDLGPGNVIVGKRLTVTLIDCGMPGYATPGWSSPLQMNDPIPPEADCEVLGIWIWRLLPWSDLGRKIMNRPDRWPVPRIEAALEQLAGKPRRALVLAGWMFSIIATAFLSLYLIRHII